MQTTTASLASPTTEIDCRADSPTCCSPGDGQAARQPPNIAAHILEAGGADGQTASYRVVMGSAAPKAVAAAIIMDRGRLLVARRGPGQHLADLWEFPGGKLEGDETPQACIVRELREELCVTVTTTDIITESLYKYPGGAINLIAVQTHLENGPICLTVHDAYEWVDPAELLNIDLAPADVPIAREVIRRCSAETAIQA